MRDSRSLGVGALVVLCAAASFGVAVVWMRQSSEVQRPAIPSELTTVSPSPERPVSPGTLDVGGEPDVSQSGDVEVGDAESAVLSGCGYPRSTGLTKHRISTGEYFLYVPRGYDPDRPVPLLVMFFMEKLRSTSGFLKNSGLTALADEKQFVIVAPQYPDMGIERTNQHVDATVRRVTPQLCLDPQRRYAIGHGGGGRRARELRCVMPLSAMATTSSGQEVDEVVCQSDPVPFIRLYGTRDARLPSNGGNGCYHGPFRSAAQVEAEWAARNDCQGRPRQYRRVDKSSCRVWECASAVAICALDGGHDWPGAKAPVSVPGCDDDPADFPIPETIWAFFEEHGRLL